MEQNSFSNTHNNNTEKKPKEEKSSKFNIDSDYDFIFLKCWPAIIRWILVIPAGILFLLITQLSLGFIANMIQKSFDSYYLSLIVDGIFMIIKFIAFEIAIVGVAPVKRERKFTAGMFLSIIPFIFLLFLTWRLTIINQSPEVYNVYYPTTTIIAQLITGTLGIILALYSIRSETNKTPENQKAQL